MNEVHNETLHRTAIPLRSIAAGELYVRRDGLTEHNQKRRK
jgi:hypothetical protein